MDKGAVSTVFQATSLLWQQYDVADAPSEVVASERVQRKSRPVDGTESSVIVWLRDAVSVQRQPSRQNYGTADEGDSWQYAASVVG